jgi:hypothetical protein
MRKLLCLTGLIIILSPAALAQEAPRKVEQSRCHCFIDHENIWTLEMVQSKEGKRTPILNIITFTPGEWDLKPSFVHVFNQKNKEARIQKFSMDTGIADEPYVSSTLRVLGNGFIGVDLMGDFDEFGEPSKVLVDLGDKRFELKPMDCLEFDMLAEQINKINFDSPNVKADFDILKIELVGTKTARPVVDPRRR